MTYLSVEITSDSTPEIAKHRIGSIKLTIWLL